MMFSFRYELDAYVLTGVLPFHYNFFFLILSWYRVSLMGAINRHITILYFKQLAVYIIFLDTKAP